MGNFVAKDGINSEGTCMLREFKRICCRESCASGKAGMYLDDVVDSWKHFQYQDRIAHGLSYQCLCEVNLSRILHNVAVCGLL